jgi:hypothetical protein
VAVDVAGEVKVAGAVAAATCAAVGGCWGEAPVTGLTDMELRSRGRVHRVKSADRRDELSDAR